MLIFNKSIFKNKTFKNFIALGFVQVANSLVPLLIYPYLIRIVGIEKFGIITIANNILFYFLVLTDFGFNLSAPKYISQNNYSNVLISRKFSVVIVTKFLLFLISILFMLFLFFFNDSFRKEIRLYTFGLSYILAHVLMMFWFFQGVQQMFYITLSNLISKCIYICSILVFINSTSDYQYIIGLQGISNLIGSFYGIYLIFKLYKIKIFVPSLLQIKQELYSNYNYFISHSSTIIINNSSLLIVSWLITDNTQINYFAVCEKIVFGFLILYNVFTQVTYPVLCQYSKNNEQYLAYLTKMTIFLWGTMLLVVFVCQYFSHEILCYFIGSAPTLQLKLMFKTLSWVILAVSLNYPTHQSLLALGLGRYQSKIYLSLSLLYVFICCLAASYLGINAVIFSFIGVQVLFFSCSFFIIYSKSEYILRQ